MIHGRRRRRAKSNNPEHVKRRDNYRRREYHDWYAPHENPETRTYRRLWAAVILQAISDAEGVDTARNEKSGGYDQRTAAAWLRNKGADLRIVCDLAGIPLASLVKVTKPIVQETE
jgi:hypothetical protein